MRHEARGMIRNGIDIAAAVTLASGWNETERRAAVMGWRD
jgi:hypothetical protein